MTKQYFYCYKPLYLMALILLFSCSNVSNSNNEFSITFPYTLSIQDVLDGNSPGQPPTLSQIADSIEYVKLGLVDGKPLGQIFNVRVTSNNIFLTTVNEPALMFSRNGEFITRLGKLGRGPAEYVSALDVVPIESKGVVAVKAYPLGDFPVYNYSGQMEKRLSRVEGSRNIEVLNGTKVYSEDMGFFTTKDGYMILSRDLNGDTVFFSKSHHDDFLNTDSWKRLQYYIITRITPYNTDTVLVLENAVDTIFSFNGKELSPRYILDIGKYNGSYADRLTQPTKAIAEASTQYIFFFETQAHLFVQMLVRNKPWLVWLDKQTGLTQGKQYPVEFWPKSTNGIARIDKTFLPNDYDGGPDFYPRAIMSNRLGVAWYYAHELMELESPSSREATNSDAQRRLASLVENLTMEDNPVIMIVHYKGGE
jgi:hypothetical protein